MKENLLAYFMAAILAFVLAQAFVKDGPRTGSVGGEVTDPSGSVVPGAKILISHNEWSETLTTDASGQFLAAGLAPGTYEVVVSSNGFAPVDRVGLMVSAGDRTEIDATLNLDALREVVTVQGIQGNRGN